MTRPLHREFNGRARRLAALVQGRVIHKTMSNTLDQLANLRRATDGVLFTHPVVLGSGRPLFDDGTSLVECDLVEHATFPDGVSMHHYTIRR